MKITIYILSFFLFSLLIMACEKEETKKIVPYNLQVKLNEVYWEPDYFTAIIRRDDKNLLAISGVVRNDAGYDRERLKINNLPLEIGLYGIPNITFSDLYAAYYTYVADGDVIDDRFILLEDGENYIEITSIDMENMKLGGNFQLTFVRDTNENVININFPDTLRFTEGVFLINMYEVLE